MDSEVIIDISIALLKNSHPALRFGITTELEPDLREIMEVLYPIYWIPGCCYNDPIFHDNIIDRHRAKSLQEDEGVVKDTFANGEEIKDQDYLLYPCWVYGYALRSRKWGQSIVIS